MASGLLLDGDLDHALGDQRTRDGGAQQVAALVHRPGPDHGEHEVARELLPQVVHITLRGAALASLGLEARELLLLADVGGEADDFRAVGFLEPAEDDRGVEAARIREYDFHVMLP
jgi:hypothetical protein